MYLFPSEIRYSQLSISNRFGDHSDHPGKYIGETLDELLIKQCRLIDIPKITVFIHNEIWFTQDNRRLWVLKKVQELGELNNFIEVKVNSKICFKKLSTVNEGHDVKIRGNPGGIYWQTWNLWRQYFKYPSSKQKYLLANNKETRFNSQIDVERSSHIENMPRLHMRANQRAKENIVCIERHTFGNTLIHGQSNPETRRIRDSRDRYANIKHFDYLKLIHFEKYRTERICGQEFSRSIHGISGNTNCYPERSATHFLVNNTESDRALHSQSAFNIDDIDVIAELLKRGIVRASTEKKRHRNRIVQNEILNNSADRKKTEYDGRNFCKNVLWAIFAIMTISWVVYFSDKGGIFIFVLGAIACLYILNLK